ncbi:B3 domain-containing transcription factor [Asimina triloba]
MSPQDYNSIFPVFPLMVEQNNPFPDFLDGFLPDLSGSLAEEVGVGLGLMENLTIFGQSLPPPPVSPAPQLELQCGGPSMTKSLRGKRKRSCRLSLLTTPSFGSFMDPNGKSPMGSGEPSWLSEVETGDFVTHPMDDSIKKQESVNDLLSLLQAAMNFIVKLLKFVLQKELRRSDVNSLGRIVLPKAGEHMKKRVHAYVERKESWTLHVGVKRDAEENLPFLNFKEGIRVCTRDLLSTDTWFMRYRYIHTCACKLVFFSLFARAIYSFIINHHREFVKKNGLRAGDFVTLYQDESKQLYIAGTKVEDLSPPVAPSTPPSNNHREGKAPSDEDDILNEIEMLGDTKSSTEGDSQSSDTTGASSSSSSSSTLNEGSLAVAAAIGPMPANDMMDEVMFVENPPAIAANEFDYEPLEGFNGFDDYDMSMYDNLAQNKRA